MVTAKAEIEKAGGKAIAVSADATSEKSSTNTILYTTPLLYVQFMKHSKPSEKNSDTPK